MCKDYFWKGMIDYYYYVLNKVCVFNKKSFVYLHFGNKTDQSAKELNQIDSRWNKGFHDALNWFRQNHRSKKRDLYPMQTAQKCSLESQFLSRSVPGISPPSHPSIDFPAHLLVIMPHPATVGYAESSTLETWSNYSAALLTSCKVVKNKALMKTLPGALLCSIRWIYAPFGGMTPGPWCQGGWNSGGTEGG